MALTLSSMQTEFLARGFSDMTSGADTTRVTRWLNDAMHEIDAMADWPYLQATTTGTAPLTIADLDTVESVTNVTNSYVLQPIDRRNLRRYFADLTTTGTALYYYIVNGVISLYPVQSSLTITVDYWKVAADMVAGTDAPAMPDRYRMAIVDYAVARGARDRGDLTISGATRQAADQLIAIMAKDLLSTQHQIAQDTVDMSGDDQ